MYSIESNSTIDFYIVSFKLQLACECTESVTLIFWYMYLNRPIYYKTVFVAEVGDYDPEEQGEGAGYLSEFKFCPKQVLIKIIKVFITLNNIIIE